MTIALWSFGVHPTVRSDLVIYCGMRRCILVADTGRYIEEHTDRLRWQGVEFAVELLTSGPTVSVVLELAIVMSEKLATRSIGVVLELAMAG